MVHFLKKNGFPMTVRIETSEFEDPKEGFKGYQSKFTDENGNEITTIYHTDLRGRIHWIDGFFTALRKYK